MKKDWYLSRTIWVGLIAEAVAVVNLLAIDPTLSTRVAETASVLLPVFLIVLRIITKRPIIE